MAVRSLGQLTLDLVAKTGSFIGPMDKASRQLNKSAKGMTRDLTSIAKGVGTFGAAATAAVTAMGVLVNNISRNAVEMQKFASVANTSVTELQAWGTVAGSLGVDTEKLSDILKDLNDRIGEFATSGTGEMKDFFDLAAQVGVTVKDFEGLSGAQSLQLVIDTIDRLGLTSQQTTFILESLADDASALSGITADAARSASELAQQLEDMGIAQDAIDSRLFQEYAQSANEAKTIISALATTFASELIPYLTEVIDRTTEYAGEVEGLDDTFREWIENAILGLGHIANAFHQFQKVSADTDVAIAEIRLAFAAFIDDALEGVAALVRALEKAEPALDALDRAFGGAGVDISAAADSIDALGNSLVAAANANLDTALGRQAETAAVDYVESAKEIIEAARERREAAKEVADAESGVDEVTRTLIDSTKGATEAEKERNKELEKTIASFKALEESLFPVEAAHERYKAGLDLINFALERNMLTEQKAAEARERLATQQSVDITGGFMNQVSTGGLLDDQEGDYWSQWLEGAQESFTSFDELAGSTIENFSSRFGDAFESMIFDANSLGEAVYDIADGMARSIVSALGEMAAQWLAYQAVQLLVGRTTQASGAAAIGANAQAMAIQAGINAFSSTAAIPIVGPALAPGAMAAALAVTEPLAAAATTAALAGMAHDGIDSVPREGTWLLDKGERVLTNPQANKLDSFLAGQGGVGSGDVAINVTNNGQPKQASASSRMEDGKLVIDVMLEDLAGDGRYFKALTGGTNVQRRGR